jgi:hypothetical protein
MRRYPLLVIALMLIAAAGCGPATMAASDIDCERNKIANMRELVEQGRVVEDSAVFDRARDDMSLSALVEMLGPATRDIGSGLHILVWEARDGSTLRASAGGLCDRVLKFERIRR